MERIEKTLCEILKGLDSKIVTYKRGFKEYIVKRNGFNSTSIPYSEIVIDKELAIGRLENDDDVEFVSSVWDSEIPGYEKIVVVNENGWVEYNQLGNVKTFDNFEIEIENPTFSSLLKAVAYTKCVKDEWSYETFDKINFDVVERKMKVNWFGDIYVSYTTLPNGSRKMIPYGQYEDGEVY